MKRKKIDWKKEVELLRQREETHRLKTQWLEGLVLKRDDEITALKEKIEEQRSHIKSLNNMLYKYVSCYEMVREAIESVENADESPSTCEDHICYVIELHDCDDDFDAVIEFIENILGDKDE